jgi:hypothetical protein
MGKSKPVRIARELEEVIKDTAEKNKISQVQASKELAKACKIKVKGNKFSREILF